MLQPWYMLTSRFTTGATCICNAYPFPHRSGAGKCKGTGWCPECFTPLEQEMIFARDDDEENEWYDVCPKCGWRSR